MAGWWQGHDMRARRVGLTILGIGAALLAMGIWASPCAADASSLYVEPSSASIALGDTLTVTVVVSWVMDLQSVDLRLTFDPAVLEVQDARPATTGTVQVAPGDIYTSFVEIRNEADNALGQIDYSVLADASPPFSGEGTVAVVTFQGIAPGSTALAFGVHELWNSITQTITHTVGEGLYQVAPPVYLPAIYRNHHTGFELIENGDCESDGGWFFRPTRYTGGYSSMRAHSGARSLRTGIEEGGTQTYSFSSATQLVDVPADASEMTLSFWVSMESVGNAADTADRHYAIIIDPWLNYHYLFFRQGVSQTHQPEWTQYVFDEALLDAFKGQQVQLHLETYNDGLRARSAMYVDDVSWLYWP